MKKIDFKKYKNLYKAYESVNLAGTNGTHNAEIYKRFNLDVNKINEHKDGTIDYNGDVNLSNQSLSEIPIRFNVVKGDFLISNNNLTELYGCPVVVNGSFNCANNNLTTLINGPKQVDLNYDCSRNDINSLEGISNDVYDLNASFNNLSTLDHLPTIGGSLMVNDNQLISLENCPTNINGDFIVCHNLLTILDNGPRVVGKPLDISNKDKRYVCDVSDNNLLNVQAMPKIIHGDFIATGNDTIFRRSDVTRVSQVKGDIII